MLSKRSMAESQCTLYLYRSSYNGEHTLLRRQHRRLVCVSVYTPTTFHAPRYQETEALHPLQLQTSLAKVHTQILLFSHIRLRYAPYMLTFPTLRRTKQQTQRDDERSHRDMILLQLYL